MIFKQAIEIHRLYSGL